MKTLRYILYEFRLYLCNYWINLIPSHSFRLWYYRHVMGFDIGKGSSIFLKCTFNSTKGFILGDNSIINSGCQLDSRGGLKIGRNVSISSETVILTADHALDSPDFEGHLKPVYIEDYVWIGTRAIILPGVRLGQGSAVAAGSVVTKNTDPFSVYAGVPAKFLRKRERNLKYNTRYRRLFN